MRKSLLFLGLAGLLAFTGCRTRTPSSATQANARAAYHESVPVFVPVFHADRLPDMDAAIEAAIATNQIPGGVLWLESGGTSYCKAYGKRSVVPTTEPMTRDTLFDAASLTKVIATTPSVMKLIEQGKLELDAPVARYLPAFATNGKDAITVRHLMTHTSGLRPGLGAPSPWNGYDKAIELACAEKLKNPVGTVFEYSDINFIVLGELVRVASGRPLNVFAEQEIFGPLKMTDTRFLPPEPLKSRIAPTEQVKDLGVLRGVVHDPTSRRMGGVAGHAGLFTTASDLARYARFLLNGGELDGVRVLKTETVKLMTSVQSPAAVSSRRGLGWDIDTGYSSLRGKWFPLGSYGHTGWTGTSIWIDPFSRTFVIFLSNRNHPTEAGSVRDLRKTLGTLAAEAVTGFDFQKPVEGALPPRAADVRNGIDVLIARKFAPLKGKRVGLITNHTGHDQDRNPTIDILHAAPGVTLKALFSPEHGIRGLLDEKVGDSTDTKTGLPVYSLYGEVRSPKPEHLKDLDVLIYDIQDIGCRFYTYPSTMGNCMQAAAKAGIPFIVLDRVNPINGVTVDGPVLTDKPSFVAYHTVTVRHGMTVGELARMFNEELGFKTDLTVIPVEGWSRSLWFDETGLPWTNPSPNMRSLTEAALYPGVGLLETTAVSVGRGTDTPFEVVGAPYIDDRKLAAEMNRAAIPGVRFVPVRFTPTASVFKGQACGGVNIILTNRDTCPVIDIGIVMASTLHRMYPKSFDISKFNRLLGHPATIEAIRAGKSIADIRSIWAADQKSFSERRTKFLMY